MMILVSFNVVPPGAIFTNKEDILEQDERKEQGEGNKGQGQGGGPSTKLRAGRREEGIAEVWSIKCTKCMKCRID
jgi:hypothetical protein